MLSAKLFGIDLQNDFILDGAPLQVQGALGDVDRIYWLVSNTMEYLDDVVLTLDQHERDHIAHPCRWRMGGSPVLPFTTIMSSMLAQGSIEPAGEFTMEQARSYASFLGGFMVWPEHCIVNTPGANLHAKVYEAVRQWMEHKKAAPTISKKGFIKDTEHFSIFQAKFKIAGNEATRFNWHLFSDLVRGDGLILVVGEAADFCVKESVEDLVGAMQSKGMDTSRVVLVEDCMSSVDVSGAAKRGFLEAMVDRGCRVLKAADVVNLLKACNG